MGYECRDGTCHYVGDVSDTVSDKISEDVGNDTTSEDTTPEGLVIEDINDINDISDVGYETDSEDVALDVPVDEDVSDVSDVDGDTTHEDVTTELPIIEDVNDIADVSDVGNETTHEDVSTDVPILEVGWPATCQEYIFQESSYLTYMHINYPMEEEPCCYDIGGPDGDIDNKLGNLLNSLSGMLSLDSNSVIAERIGAGSTVLLFEFREFDDGASDDPSIIMPFFYGKIHGCSENDCSVQSDAVAGNGAFTASEDFFEIDSGGCTGTPLIKSEQAYVESNHLVVGPSVFIIPLPIMWIILDVEIQNSLLEADLSYEPSGITMTNGKLGGAIPIASIIDGFNQYVSESCRCLEVANGNNLVTYEITDSFYVQCNEVSNNCGGENEDCQMFGDMCGMIFNLIAGQADIDTDDDGVTESLSVGLNFEGVSAQVFAP